MPYLLKAAPYDPALAAERVLYFSDIGFVSEPTDAPANVYWVRRIDAPYALKRSLWQGSDVGGYSEAGFGAAKLANDDGALDWLWDLAWDGRLVQVWYTPVERPAMADFVLVFNGTAESVTPGDSFEIKLRELQVLLDVPASRGRFTGAGGLEGTSELKGREKPWLLGRRRQLAPLLIDSASWTYMIDPAGFRAILEVRDAGKVLGAVGPDVADLAALKALSMAGVDYATCKAAGLVRLRTKPYGDLTLSAEGVCGAGGQWLFSGAQLVQHAATAFAKLPASDLAASFTALHALQPAVLGYWCDGSSVPTVSALIDELCDTIGGYWGFNEDRKLEAARFDGPAAAADLSFSDREILELRPRATDQRLKGLRLGWRPYSKVLSEANIVADPSIGAAEREAMQQDIRWTATGTHAGAMVESLLAREEEVRTLFDLEVDAGAERDRRLALWGPRRKSFEVDLPLTPGLRAGQTIALTSARYGLSAGQRFLVLECEADADTDEHRTVVWG